MKKRIELLASGRMYEGFLKLNRHRLRHESYQSGWCQEIVRERLEGLNAVSVLLYDPLREQVVLVEQFRIGAMGSVAEPWILETVGGFRGPGETPEEVAHREAKEETDCVLLSLLHIGDFFVSPGISSEQISLYCARVDSSNAGGIHGLDHEGEEIKVVVLPVEEAMRELFCRINSTSSIIALQWLAANRDRVRKDWLAGATNP